MSMSINQVNNISLNKIYKWCRNGDKKNILKVGDEILTREEYFGEFITIACTYNRTNLVELFYLWNLYYLDDLLYYQLLINAVNHNNLSMVNCLYNLKSSNPITDDDTYKKLLFKLLNIACISENLKIMKRIIEIAYIDKILLNVSDEFNKILIYACKVHNLKIVQFLCSHETFVINYYLATQLILLSDIFISEYLFDRILSFINIPLDKFIEFFQTHSETKKITLINRYPSLLSENYILCLFYIMCEMGLLQIIHYIYDYAKQYNREQKLFSNNNVLAVAVRSNNFKLISTLLKWYNSWDTSFIDDTIHNSDIIKILQDYNYEKNITPVFYNKFECNICFEESSTNVVTTNCAHQMCAACFKKNYTNSASPTCPFCRAKLV